jgi:hypothetical protein
MRNWVKGLGVTLLVSAVACSSSGGGGSVTGVAGNKTLMTLSSADAMQLCTDTGKYVGNNLSTADLCKLTAILAAGFSGATTDADLQAACTTAFNSCTTSSAGGDGGATQCTIDTSSCNATVTVSQFSACITDDVSATKATLNALPSCSAVTIAGLNSDAGTGSSNPPASCATLMSACPGLALPGL